MQIGAASALIVLVFNFTIGHPDADLEAGELHCVYLGRKGKRMFKGLEAQRLLALFAAGWLVLNFPLLGLWDLNVRVLGLPLFPLALLCLWAGLIFALAWLMERNTLNDQDD
jgi:hypothetical protein